MARNVGQFSESVELEDPGPQAPQQQRVNQVELLNKRRRIALGEIDNASFSRFHAKLSFIAGAGFFTDAYDMFSISIVVTMLGYVYGDENGDLTSWQSTGLKVATPVGNLVGQLIFGWFGDIFGRKRMYGAELIIMVIATFGQALAGQAPAANIVGVLIVWRFLLGIGIGGDYPASAIITSEFAATQTRGRLMTAVFACQGWGQLAAGLVGLAVVGAYKDAIINAPYPAAMPVDYTWRLLVGLGCIPGLIAYYFRLTIPETPRFTMDIQRQLIRAARDIERVLATRRQVFTADEIDRQRIIIPRPSFSDFVAYFSVWKNMKILIGTAYSWFALDIPFYSLTLNSAAILTYSNFGKTPGQTSGEDVYNSLFRICSGNLILTVAGYIPGFWACFLLIDSWGRKPIQLMGFVSLTILFWIMAFAHDTLISSVAGQNAFIALFCLANFFENFGPNTTTFIIPGEVFPTRYRSTAHGLSAACGKIGAVIAQLALGQPLLQNPADIKIILEVLSFVMMTGVLSTLLLPETKQKTLEDLSNEEQDFYITGAEP